MLAEVCIQTKTIVSSSEIVPQLSPLQPSVELTGNPEHAKHLGMLPDDQATSTLLLCD